MANTYSIPTIEQTRNVLKSVAPKWRFLAIMPEVTQEVTTNYDFSNNGGAAYYSGANRLSRAQIPNAVCESVDIPQVTVDTDQRFGQGTKINVARFLSSGNITLNFYEDDAYNVSKYLWAWHLENIDDYNLHGLPYNYKKPISVWIFNSLSNSSPVTIVDFIDCFPTNPIGGLSYSQNENGFLIVSCEFTVDNQSFQFIGSPPPTQQ